MDAQLAILSGQTMTAGTGPSAATPSGEHGFEALLAAVSPVTPVPPVTARPGSGPSPAKPPSAASAPSGSTALSTGAASVPTAQGATPGAASITAPTTGGLPAAGSIPTAAAGHVAGGSEPTGLPQNSVATGPAHGQAAAPLSGQAATPADQPVTQTMAKTGGSPPLTASGPNPGESGGVAATSSPSVGSPAMKTNRADPSAMAAPAENGGAAKMAAKAPEGAAQVNAPSASNNTTPSTPPALLAAMPSGASISNDPAVLAAMAPEAGVQARRAAEGGLVPPTSPPTAKNAAKQASSTAPAPAGQVSAPAATGKAATLAVPQAAAPETPAQPVAEEAATSRLPAEGRSAAALPAEPQTASSSSDAESLELGQTRAAETARAAERPGTAAGTARFTPANAGALAAQIAARFQNGERRFEIRMDPPELGRVEVRLHVGQDNRVQAILSADRPETLQDMRQHIRELERALNEAGLDLDEDGLSFELSQDQDDRPDDSSPASAFTELALAEDRSGDVMAAAPPRELYGFRLASGGGVDIRL